MTINWSRGLFRLWLVLSLIWICAGGSLLWSDLRNAVAPATIETHTFRYAGSAGNKERDAVPALLGPPVTDPDLLAKLDEPLDERIRRIRANLERMIATSVSERDIDAYLAQEGFSVEQWRAAVREFDRRRDRTNHKATLALGIILVPPVTVLLFGTLLFWAVRGFTTR